jgi:hypothetical protein
MRRPEEKREDGSLKTERNSWDFVVDGISLRSTWQDPESFGVMADFVGLLGWNGADLDRNSVARLQGEAEPDYSPNRVAIYVCPECGDLGCGAVTVAVTREEGAITWSDFRYEVNWYADHPEECTVRFDLGPFRFESTAYSEVLNHALLLSPQDG